MSIFREMRVFSMRATSAILTPPYSESSMISPAPPTWNSMPSSSSTTAISSTTLRALPVSSVNPLTVVSMSIVLRWSTPTSEDISMPPLSTKLSRYGEFASLSRNRSMA